MQLDGRNAIVTEAAESIGAATVTTLIERGAHILAHDIAAVRLIKAHGTNKC
jgi:NAD(P)-dependent dehydrogenase (short-subunit alcohol dehydrogenase family)